MLKRFIAGVLVALVGSTSFAVAQADVRLDSVTGLFRKTEGAHDIVLPTWAFWTGDWKWVAPIGQLNNVDGRQVMTVKNRETGLSVRGDIAQPSQGVTTWDFELQETMAPDVYGGITFKIRERTGDAGSNDERTRLLPDNDGWELLGAEGRVEMRVTFSPKPRELYFEKGNQRDIRAYFITRNGERETVKVRMTVKTGAGLDAMASTGTQPAWTRGGLTFVDAPIDLSYLNAKDKPAGKRGFLRAEGETFRFADGTEARFWGTNLTANALFSTPKDQIQAHARRLSRLGFNLVRIHHHDAAWISPNIFANPETDTRTLSKTSLDHLDWWIKCLKEEGIYVWLDLHIGRVFTAGDGIRNFAELTRTQDKAYGFGFAYLNPDIEQRMQEFNAALLDRVNPYTGVKYTDEPAIVGLLITNENDLSMHFGNLFLPEKGASEHSRTYLALARQFAVKHKLDPEKTWRSWEQGPSKIFLADLEHAFNQRMTGHLRRLGVRVPIATTNFWGQMSLSSLPALTGGDVIDAHSYAAANEFRRDPRSHANMISWIAAGAVIGKPLTVSEWNVEPFPAFDRSAHVIRIAAMARLQGWPAVMQYAYAMDPLHRQGVPHNYQAYNDPAFLAVMPAAALLYREGHVAPALHTYVLQLSAEEFMGREVNPKTSRAIRTVSEVSRLRIAVPEVPQLPWLKASVVPEGVKRLTSKDTDVIGEGRSQICSDTREICHDWETGFFTVDTPGTQAAVGWIGGRTIELSGVSLELATPHATISVQSLDSRPIAASQRLLVSAMADAKPSPGNRMPYLSEPVSGRLRIKAPAGLEAFAILADGRKRALKPAYENGAYVLSLDDAPGVHFISFEKIVAN